MEDRDCNGLCVVILGVHNLSCAVHNFQLGKPDPKPSTVIVISTKPGRVEDNESHSFHLSLPAQARSLLTDLETGKTQIVKEGHEVLERTGEIYDVLNLKPVIRLFGGRRGQHAQGCCALDVVITCADYEVV